ncbi:calcium-activated chloride channel regulator 4-like [Watersipora subatra]|uniref:calcium-activated chloride channel regulator 4-like n=1 Tax=Watersipora subatra TaxID=2589382 RepID=UPI00355BA276
MVAMTASSNIGNDRQNINLSPDGGYTDILVAIDDNVPENMNIIYKLQDYFTEASNILLAATHNRHYFKSLTILVPETWKPNSAWSEPKEKETMARARVVVARPNLAYGNEPYTRQPGSCGQEGDFIHFTPEYLTQNLNVDNGKIHRPEKRIVKEFAKLKWGLFDENIPVTDTQTPLLYLQDGNLWMQGCIEGTSFKFDSACVITKIPPPQESCKAVPTEIPGAASLLAYEYFDEAVEFCSKDGKTAHNLLSTNLQNKLCQSKSSWEVMLSLDDFVTDYGQNRSLEFSTEPTFRVAQVKSASRACQQDVVCLCLDVSRSMRDNNRIVVMSEAVQLYIMSYMRNGSAVGIVSFNNTEILNADITELTSESVRASLITKVPTTARGRTNIGAGLTKCHQILSDYTGGDLKGTRILLHSDGQGEVGDSVERAVSEGIIIDTVLFDQGGFLSNGTELTGGLEYLASDGKGKTGLLAFYEATAMRSCDSEHKETLITNEQIVIPLGKSTHQGRAYFDRTIGRNSKISFQYDLDVSVELLGNLKTFVTDNVNLRTITILVESDIVGFIDYIITKANLTAPASVIVTVTSSSIPGVPSIEVSNKMNSRNIQFSATTELVTYAGLFQEFSPVLQLTVLGILEDPNGTLIYIPHNDDGTGSDSIPNDGFYTGHLGAHQISGVPGEKFYGLKLSISGEGIIPRPEVVGKRRKRCSNCDSLGNVTRSVTGGVIVIDGWVPLPDHTPPETITDLIVLQTSKELGLFTLGWTAPGEDLDIGQVSGYEFKVGTSFSISDMFDLRSDAILSDVSTFLVKAGTYLDTQIRADALTPDIFGLPESANISTYYFRVRTYDSSNNYANWSNPVSASFVDPRTITALLGTTTTSQPSQMKGNESVTLEVVEVGTTSSVIIILGVALFLTGCVTLAVAIAVIVAHQTSANMKVKQE